MSKVTLKSIAEELKVHPAVVTRIMKNKSTSVSISTETKERVLTLAMQKGWRSNDNIGVLAPESVLDYEYYYNAFIAGVFSEANKSGAGIMSGIFPDDCDASYQLPEFLVKRRVSGVVFLHRSPKIITDFLDDEKIPYIHASPEEHCNQDSVMIGGYAAMAELLEILKSKGYKRFVFCTYGLASLDGRNRIQAFNDFIAETMCQGRTMLLGSGKREEVNNDIAQEIIAASPETVFINDSRFYTIYCLELFAKYGKKMPEDAGLVGHSLLADLHEPKLTTIKYPVSDIGSEAVSMVWEKWNSCNSKLQSRQLKGNVVLNHSTR